MTLPVRMAISLPISHEYQENLRWARWAETEGFESAWLADVGGADALTLCAALATETKKLRFGLAVVPVYTRTPAVLASTTLALHQIAPGRFVMGLGASSHTIIEDWNGIAYTKPLTRLRESTQILRSALEGKKTAFQGETVSSDGFSLPGLPEGNMPLYLAALRPKMLEMAGEYGDGVILNLFPLSALPQMLAHIQQGAQRGGKTLDSMEIVNRHHVIVTDNPARARTLFRQRFAPYFATPVYNRFLAWCGYPQAATQIKEGWKKKDRTQTTGALSDEMVDKLAVIGDADTCRETIRQFIAKGITTPIINPISADPDEIKATLEAFTCKNFSVSTS